MPIPPPQDPDRPYHVCFVCLGNICRSPVAEVVARARLAEAGLDAAVVVDSAGTGNWHVGDKMNAGSREVLADGGYDGEAHRAREFDSSWQPDLVLAMDRNNLNILKSIYQMDGGDSSRIRLFGEVAGLGGAAEVPDPYGGPSEEFALVLDMIESAMPTLITQLAEVTSR